MFAHPFAERSINLKIKVTFPVEEVKTIVLDVVENTLGQHSYNAGKVHSFGTPQNYSKIHDDDDDTPGSAVDQFRCGEGAIAN